MFSLKGKCALITGGAGGIGRAIAKVFKEQGAVIALADMNKEALDAAAAELGNEGIYTFVCNVTNVEELKQLAKDAEAQMGSIDILMNNVGITQDALSMRMTDEQWQKVIDINLSSIFKLTRAVIPSMMKRRYGRIINMASVVGVMGNAGQANYCASKGGMIAMGKAIAEEVASRGITVNAIAPGFIKTAMTDALSDEAKERLAKRIPMVRLGTPEDVAATAAFLASDEAGYITGQTIHVNGGMLRV